MRWLLPLSLVPGFFYYNEPLKEGERGINYNYATEATVLAFVTCLYILANLYHPVTFLVRIGESRTIKFLTSISYAHSMTHYWIMEVIQNHYPSVFMSPPVDFFCYLYCSFIITIMPIPVSYLCLKLIEEPFWKIEKVALKWIEKKKEA